MAPQAKNQKWKIGESVLDVLVSGHSFLDSKEGFKGSFPTPESAEKFLLAYGYDTHDPIEQAELHGNLQEAIRFIQRYFLKPGNPAGLSLEMPKKIHDVQDIRELLHYASNDQPADYRNWACSILRVVHTISHVDRDMRTHYFGEIQKQIFDRFYRYLHRDEEGKLYLGRSELDPLRVDLVEFQVKPRKARDSTLMKLLHKSQSVAEELFDTVGMRFVTKDRVDSIRVIHFLEQAHVIVAANIKPNRSRNTLIDTKAFKEVLSRGLSESQIETLLSEISYPQTKPEQNPFSSEHYRAIQFTCRQLIKLKNPLADQLRDLKQLIRSKSTDQTIAHEVSTAIDRLDPKLVQRMIRFFYAYEIQVMDEHSYIENEKGRSAHTEYKKAQQQAAMMRVMGALAHEAKS